MIAGVAIDRLRLALDDLARALASGDADAVLQAEPPLAEALRALASVEVAGLDSAARWRVRQQLDAALGALARCEALGDVVHDYAAAVSEPSTGYGRGGRRPARATLAPVLDSRL